jgi:LPXTG-motif cell wall-anchored protein
VILIITIKEKGFMRKLSAYTHYFIVIGLALLLTAGAQLGNKHIAWAEGPAFQGTIPNPGGGGGDGGDGGGDSGGSTGQIIGTVTDLSTGSPGAGITVVINRTEVRTDGAGKYSLSGLAAGNYEVTLALPGTAVPAQGPVTVYVDGRSNTVVDLSYYSSPPPDGAVQATPAPTTVPAATTDPMTTTTTITTGITAPASQPATADTATEASFPTQLPQTGADSGWWMIVALGLASLCLGLGLAVWKRLPT